MRPGKYALCVCLALASVVPVAQGFTEIRLAEVLTGCVSACSVSLPQTRRLLLVWRWAAEARYPERQRRCVVRSPVVVSYVVRSPVLVLDRRCVVVVRRARWCHTFKTNLPCALDSVRQVSPRLCSLCPLRGQQTNANRWLLPTGDSLCFCW